MAGAIGSGLPPLTPLLGKALVRNGCSYCTICTCTVQYRIVVITFCIIVRVPLLHPILVYGRLTFRKLVDSQNVSPGTR
jgi:hypothetical protein